jgi:hypothetical protein
MRAGRSANKGSKGSRGQPPVGGCHPETSNDTVEKWHLWHCGIGSSGGAQTCPVHPSSFHSLSRRPLAASCRVDADRRVAHRGEDVQYVYRILPSSSLLFYSPPLSLPPPLVLRLLTPHNVLLRRLTHEQEGLVSAAYRFTSKQNRRLSQR